MEAHRHEVGFSTTGEARIVRSSAGIDPSSQFCFQELDHLFS